ncbi:hypothetical protein BEN47_03575 [Hymenobacter lapidarius]|uniref:Uncharacterized protein n=1 Tax=Hymenobacter lapidarius TaxID=1908237 RepID=A0A1G1SXN7_9BACT|nr:hypothetical protein [Hymenobacter lapidarius]OGX83382.1 hypothetical protein BEN47_03575 [Hymenobacter lapidarius]
MFENYDIDFGKLHLNWMHSVRIELDEIRELIQQATQVSTYIRPAGQFERVGYTNSYRKFIAVVFTLREHTIVIDDVNLADYGAIRKAVIKQFLEETN